MDMPSDIVDAHQHFWRLSNHYTQWPTPDLTAIYKDCGPEDLGMAIGPAGVRQTVLVQAAPSTEETEALLRLAEKTPLVAGVVGWVDFDDPAGAAADLRRWAEAPAFKGVRPMLQAIPRTDYILDASMAPLFESLIEHGLSLDALIQPRHLPVIEELARRHPQLGIVIDHGAKPDIAGRAFDPWAEAIGRFGPYWNVHCKLSGLLTEAAAGDGEIAIAPYVDHIGKVFGPERTMWGSDWPVVELVSSYGEWLTMAQTLVSAMPEAARAQIFAATARRFYRLDRP